MNTLMLIELLPAWCFLAGAFFSVIFIAIFDRIVQKQFDKHFSPDENKAKGTNKNIQVKIERLK